MAVVVMHHMLGNGGVRPITGKRVGAEYRHADLGEMPRRHGMALLATRAEHANGPRRTSSVPCGPFY